MHDNPESNDELMNRTTNKMNTTHNPARYLATNSLKECAIITSQKQNPLNSRLIALLMRKRNCCRYLTFHITAAHLTYKCHYMQIF